MLLLLVRVPAMLLLQMLLLQMLLPLLRHALQGQTPCADVARV
jgi:hypothetical protein